MANNRERGTKIWLPVCASLCSIGAFQQTLVVISVLLYELSVTCFFYRVLNQDNTTITIKEIECGNIIHKNRPTWPS